MKMVKVVYFVPFAWSDTLREGHRKMTNIGMAINTGSFICPICKVKKMSKKRLKEHKIEKHGV